MNTHHVTIEAEPGYGAEVFQDGVRIASISSAPECYICPIKDGREDRPIARFKYARPKANAIRWSLFVFGRLSMEELEVALLDKPHLTVAIELGYNPDPWLRGAEDTTGEWDN